jgi:arylsulfatase A-like enzyme
VFLSDHGEALGRDGFWVHSVFLWECLVKVPLLVRIPGVSPRAVEAPVSLADLAPTLARYLEVEPSMRGYQGEDLLGNLVPDRPARRVPILMSGASRDTLVRVGMIDQSGRWKLVLSLEAALPELYDLNAPDPDAVTVAEMHAAQTTKMLRGLMASPVAPRSPKDFEPLLP